MLTIWIDMALEEETGTPEQVRFYGRKGLSTDWATDQKLELKSSAHKGFILSLDQAGKEDSKVDRRF